MLKTLDNRSLQEKFKKFKKKLSRDWKDRTPERIIFKEVPSEKSILEIEISETTSSSKGVRKKNTIKPAGLFKKKYSFTNRSAEKPKQTPSKYTLFTDKSKISKTYENSESAYASFENSQCDLMSNNSVSKNNIFDVYDFTENEHILSQTEQKSLFRLKNPELFRNHDKPEISNKETQLSFVKTDDVKIDKSELTSSDFSFSTPEIKKQNSSVMNRTPPQVFDALKNDHLHSYNNQMHYLSEARRNEILTWILSCNRISSSDTADGESSTDFTSSTHDERTLADVMFKTYSASDDEMRSNNSTIPTLGATKLQNFTDTSCDSINITPNFLPELLQKNRVSNTVNGESLHFEKRQVQWHTCPDSLESALTTSMEKLNEIKHLL